MKSKLVLLPLFLLLFSCQVEGELTDGNEVTVITPTAVLKYQGVFEPTSGITVNGEAKIYLEDGQYKVHLENFSISDGPDLKVYLSKAATPTEYVNLGSLTSQTVYSIPMVVDVASYTHVLIHCQQYNHLFAIAPLTSN